MQYTGVRICWVKGMYCSCSNIRSILSSKLSKELKGLSGQHIYYNSTTRHTHCVNASCSYEVHEDIICMHTNGSLEDVALL